MLIPVFHILQEIRQRHEEGKKVTFISDMYLPSAFLKTVLQTGGVSGWDGFYVSCERKARKSTGELYKIMLSEMNVKPDMVINLAAISSVGLSWKIPQKTMEVNVIGALNILEASYPH